MKTRGAAATASDLYRRWERQQWNAQAIDLALDRRMWLALDEHERWKWYCLAGFAHFRASESHAVVCLAKLIPCLPRPEQQCFLATQVADEARHTYFFHRFHQDVLESALPARAYEQAAISPAYQRLFFDSLTEVIDGAASHSSCSALAVAAFQAFIVLEGAIALASLAVLRRVLTKLDRFPGLLNGVTFAHRDEIRHVEFGISVLDDLFATQPSSRDAVVGHLRDLVPLFSEVLEPRPERKEVLQSFRLNPYERRRRAFTLLQRHLERLGIEVDAVERWAAAA